MIKHDRFAKFETAVFDYEMAVNRNADASEMSARRWRILSTLTPEMCVDIVHELQDMECAILEAGERE